MMLTTSDRERLTSLLKSGRTPAAGDTPRRLTSAMASAAIVTPESVPPTVITMNSIAELIDISSGEVATYALVYPADANVDRLKVSVLAPLGTALLGRSEGEIIEYEVPSGTKKFFVKKVTFQPESRFRTEASSAPAA